MLGYDRRSVAARRDDGIRRVTRLTWRAGVVGVVCSALIAVAFGRHADAEAAHPAHPGQSGTIVVPNQPPAPVTGGGQVTSGSS